VPLPLSKNGKKTKNSKKEEASQDPLLMCQEEAEEEEDPSYQSESEIDEVNIIIKVRNRPY